MEDEYDLNKSFRSQTLQRTVLMEIMLIMSIGKKVTGFPLYTIWYRLVMEEILSNGEEKWKD